MLLERALLRNGVLSRVGRSLVRMNFDAAVQGVVEKEEARFGDGQRLVANKERGRRANGILQQMVRSMPLG